MSIMNRRSFLKISAQGALNLTPMGVNAVAEEKGLYIPGTYSATASGLAEVKMTMNFDANSTTEAVVDKAICLDACFVHDIIVKRLPSIKRSGTL
ncbi:MAG: hypothetical protein IJ313_06635 [Clostridia bacterium]|nr:hypothetical protein [Clostridia bacterium]